MWKWIKIPKAIAIVAFFLPWMTISCSNQPLVTASGLDLTLGQLKAANAGLGAMSAGPPPQGQGVSIWLILAIAAIVIGLVVACMQRSRRNSLIVTASSAAAVVLIWLGTSKYSNSALGAEIAKNANKNGGMGGLGGGPSGMDPQAMAQTMAAGIRIDWHFGFWLTILMLVLAAAMGWLTYTGKDEDVLGGLRSNNKDIGEPPD